MALIMTAVQYGATVANYVEVIEVLKDSKGMTCGAKMRDTITGATWDVAAKVNFFSNSYFLNNFPFSNKSQFADFYYLDSFHKFLGSYKCYWTFH